MRASNSSASPLCSTIRARLSLIAPTLRTSQAAVPRPRAIASWQSRQPKPPQTVGSSPASVFATSAASVLTAHTTLSSTPARGAAPLLEWPPPPVLVVVCGGAECVGEALAAQRRPRSRPARDKSPHLPRLVCSMRAALTVAGKAAASEHSSARSCAGSTALATLLLPPTPPPSCAASCDLLISIPASGLALKRANKQPRPRPPWSKGSSGNLGTCKPAAALLPLSTPH